MSSSPCINAGQGNGGTGSQIPVKLDSGGLKFGPGLVCSCNSRDDPQVPSSSWPLGDLPAVFSSGSVLLFPKACKVLALSPSCSPVAAEGLWRTSTPLGFQCQSKALS